MIQNKLHKPKNYQSSIRLIGGFSSQKASVVRDGIFKYLDRRTYPR